MIKVPCSLPSTSEITIADANMPKMIQNRSMLVPAQVPPVITQLNQAQQGQGDQHRQQEKHRRTPALLRRFALRSIADQRRALRL